jgi:hypothetical protein
VSRLLLAEGWNDFAQLFGGTWLRAAADLDASGEPTFRCAFGADFWPWLAEHPEERASFDRAMAQGTEGRLDRLASIPWRGDETVVDVGGGSGSLLVALLGRQPGLRGIVFDLPETVVDRASLGDRITFLAGDFFDRVPAGDVYVLSTVLHDWDDERAAAILRTIRRTAGNEPHGAKWLDLLMLALFGGRERDETEWRTLLHATGFEPVRFGERMIEAECR